MRKPTHPTLNCVAKPVPLKDRLSPPHNSLSQVTIHPVLCAPPESYTTPRMPLYSDVITSPIRVLFLFPKDYQ